MRRSFLRAALIAAGLCLMLVGLGSWLGLGTTSARAQQPPIRPTLTPAPSATPDQSRSTPTPTPKRAPGPNRDDHKDEQPAALGRITGTVIDLTTGAPAPGIAVLVGDVTAITDANGNYDLPGLPADNYAVALALRAEQGVPAQESITVPLGAGATVVQHLAFRSPAPPTTAPAAAPLTTLPATGGSVDSGWSLLALGAGLIVLGMRLRRRGVEQ
jgi:Carboxypeptidase regulatory-like domain